MNQNNETVVKPEMREQLKKMGLFPTPSREDRALGAPV